MDQVADRVARALTKILALELVGTARAADMRIFHFGTLRIDRGREIGAVALHLQGPWRIDGPDGIVAGRDDLYQPIEPLTGEAFERWDWETDGNLQDARLAGWLGLASGFEGTVPVRLRPRVSMVRATTHGGAEIDLSGGERLTLFTGGARGESWRLIPAGDHSLHFVIADGAVEDD